MAAPEFDIALDHNKVQEEVFQLLALLKPDWRKDDVKIKVLEDGHVNVMIACYVTKLEESVVVRVFGDMIVFPIHKKPGREIKTVRVMNELGLCVPILCTFNNGYCMEFVHGETIGMGSIHQIGFDVVIRDSLRELARYHSNEHAELAKEMGLDDTPVIFENCEFALGLQPDFDDPKIMASFGDAELPPDMKGELDAIEKKLLRLLKEADMPVAFCHNDTNPTNVFFDQETKSVTFLDYESCAFNYVAYDIAYLVLVTMTGARVDAKKHMPTKEVVVTYLKYYLECRCKQGDMDAVTDEMVETWYKHYQLTALAMNFWLGLVVLLFTKRPSHEVAKDSEKAKMWLMLNDIPVPETEEEIMKLLSQMIFKMFANRFLLVKEELDKI
ncbi:ethanolamine kinase 2-like [Lineus longissimus]|uniref:ethanolamine kinase 2-like n=1 Tax=Lineus longissimus TaxID=88925 RepID=UPI002B4C7372